MDDDILRSNMIVKKSSNTLVNFCTHSLKEEAKVSYYTKIIEKNKCHVILYQKENNKQFLSNLTLLDNIYSNITIYTDDDKLNNKSKNNIDCVNCDIQREFRLIFSMGTVMAMKRNNQDVRDVLDDIMSVVNSISMKSKNFIKMLERVLDVKYPLSSNQKKYISYFYKKYKKKYNEAYKKSFRDIVFTILNEKTSHEIDKIEELMLEFTEISKKYFQIVLDWIYLYQIENSKDIVIIYAEEEHIKNMEKYIRHNGFVNRLTYEEKNEESKCVIQ